MPVLTATANPVIEQVGEIVTAATSWVGNFATTIAGQPMLLFFVALPVVGLGIGLIKRLINVNSFPHREELSAPKN